MAAWLWYSRITLITKYGGINSNNALSETLAWRHVSKKRRAWRAAGAKIVALSMAWRITSLNDSENTINGMAKPVSTYVGVVIISEECLWRQAAIIMCRIRHRADKRNEACCKHLSNSNRSGNNDSIFGSIINQQKKQWPPSSRRAAAEGRDGA
jgi:hypothetical protein